MLIGSLQIRADSIHNQLQQTIPNDALCLVGLTMADLYEDDPDLFVAGLAAGNLRVAVSGINFLIINVIIKIGKVTNLPTPPPPHTHTHAHTTTTIPTRKRLLNVHVGSEILIFDQILNGILQSAKIVLDFWSFGFLFDTVTGQPYY